MTYKMLVNNMSYNIAAYIIRWRFNGLHGGKNGVYFKPFTFDPPMRRSDGRTHTHTHAQSHTHTHIHTLTHALTHAHITHTRTHSDECNTRESNLLHCA